MGGDQIILQHFDLVRNIVKNINRDYLECFINIGSSDEYGSCEAPQNENSRESPISLYSFSKLASTHLIEMLYRTEIQRLFFKALLNLWTLSRQRRFIPQIISGCLKNERFPVSAGKQKRDFCYIDDVVMGILKYSLVRKYMVKHII